MARQPQNLTVEVGAETKVGDKFSVPLICTFLDRGDPVAGETIDFYVNGANIGSANTDENGIASIPALNLNPGNHPVMTIVRGRRDRATGVARIREQRTETRSAAPTATKSVQLFPYVTNVGGNKSIVTFVVVDKDNKPLKDQVIHITDPTGTNETVTTDANGKASKQYTLAPGEERRGQAYRVGAVTRTRELQRS